MIELVSQTEARPADYPPDSGLTLDAGAIVWQRIEHYIAWRFTPRQVVWHVDSTGGEWAPPLRPVVALTARKWTGTAFEVSALAPAPLGWTIPAGRYELTATVGEGPAPEAAAAAARLLAEYLGIRGEYTGEARRVLPLGVRSYSANVGQLSESFSADPAAMARALQNSGAADLLRPYRRVR
ncbi:hypothetical protein [uncultured Paracoccus sp.]|uniref:hypothetical protein n=1 Tax=uncultured Paracoccus sp. TaxID=189685 RepID=UPI0026235091|nr:hypothetical protein [uncultured Paracoccus sp.]